MKIKFCLAAVCIFFISVKCLAFDLIVSGGLKGKVIEGRFTYEAPMGTKYVTLLYNVRTM